MQTVSYVYVKLREGLHPTVEGPFEALERFQPHYAVVIRPQNDLLVEEIMSKVLITDHSKQLTSRGAVVSLGWVKNP